jgi:hypothetical protein
MTDRRDGKPGLDIVVRDESGQRRSPQEVSQGRRQAGRRRFAIGTNRQNGRQRLPGWKAAVDHGRRVMPVALGVEIVLRRDDLLALQDKTILIDEICDDRQHEQWNQEEQGRSPEFFHIQVGLFARTFMARNAAGCQCRIGIRSGTLLARQTHQPLPFPNRVRESKQASGIRAGAPYHSR